MPWRYKDFQPGNLARFNLLEFVGDQPVMGCGLVLRKGVFGEGNKILGGLSPVEKLSCSISPLNQ